MKIIKTDIKTISKEELEGFEAKSMFEFIKKEAEKYDISKFVDKMKLTDLALISFPLIFLIRPAREIANSAIICFCLYNIAKIWESKLEKSKLKEKGK